LSQPARQEEEDLPARRVLERLLHRAEAAWLAGDAKSISLRMDGKRDGAEYLALRGVADFEAFHARIALAERAGAVTVERERHRDDGARLKRIAVRDMAALAQELGTDLLSARVDRAALMLEPWIALFPVVAEVLAAWRVGRKVRGRGPDAADALADAARAAEALQVDARGERILRKASAELLGNSKRLESLTTWLDLLVTGELAPSGLEDEQVWSALGLRKEPQPLLLAGQGVIELEDGSRHVLPRRWLGFPVEGVRRLATEARVLLTIENLTSFHEAAASRGDMPILLLYTGGMPSPAWRAAYARLLAGLPAEALLYHWGDIDRGGFRIAAKLAETAVSGNRHLRPWLMSPDAMPVGLDVGTEPPAPAILATMCSWARRAGWDDVASALQRTPLTLEQEHLAPRLPG
jgi:hypothetical protein